MWDKNFCIFFLCGVQGAFGLERFLVGYCSVNYWHIGRIEECCVHIITADEGVGTDLAGKFMKQMGQRNNMLPILVAGCGNKQHGFITCGKV